jgi:dihydrofolate reductase
MSDTEPQTAGGKVLWHFTMSLDGFVAGPNHEMDWLTGTSSRPGLVEEYVQTTGAVLGGRAGWDHFPDVNLVYGGAWDGPIFVLTHHPEDATPADRVTFLSCDPAEAVRIGLAAAGGKNLEVFSPTIGRQLLDWADRRDRPAHRAGPARPGHRAVRQPRRCADPPPPGRRRRPHRGRKPTVPTRHNNKDPRQAVTLGKRSYAIRWCEPTASRQSWRRGLDPECPLKEVR